MMEWLSWQQPWWLLLTIVPLLPRLLPARDRHPRLEQFIARHLWPQLLTGTNSAHKNRGPLFLLAWLFACIALAGPITLTEQQRDELNRETNIAIVLDISPSMRVQDVSPSRITYSKQLLTELATQLDGQRVALIVFSANAYTVLPLTRDNHVLKQMIEAMDPTLASTTGSNVGRALQLAQQALSVPTAGATKTDAGMVLLISDGEIHDKGALTASRQLHQAGHRLFTLGVGTDQGGPVPFATGKFITEGNVLVTSRLDRHTLRTLAQSGGGNYADLRPESWPAILEVVEEMKQPQHNSRNSRHGTELFPWFLALALITFLWNGVRRPGHVAPALLLALPLIINSPTTEAAPWDEARGLTLLQQKNHTAALELYQQLNNYNGQLGSGVAAYRLGRWQQALDAFNQALKLARSNQEKADAAYNGGNTLVQLGQLESAAAAYKTALFWQPGYANANHNLALLQRNQAKGGERKAESDFRRQGEGGEQQQERPDNNSDSSANDTHAPSSATTTGQPNGEGAEKQQALQQSLKQWRQQQNNHSATTAQTQQQLNTLKEDYQTMLKQRFAAEDSSETSGLVIDKPW